MASEPRETGVVRVVVAGSGVEVQGSMGRVEGEEWSVQKLNSQEGLRVERTMSVDAPNKPLTERVVEVSTPEELDAAMKSGTEVVVREENTIENIEVQVGDVVVRGVTRETKITGHVRTYPEIARVRVSSLQCRQVRIEGSTDIRIGHVIIDCPDVSGGQPMEFVGTRIAVLNTKIIGRTDCGGVWSAGGASHVSIQDTEMTVDGREWNFRVYNLKVGELVRCTLTNPGKHNIRLHNDCEDFSVSHCSLFQGGVMIDPDSLHGGAPNERLSFRRNLIQHTHDDLLKTYDTRDPGVWSALGLTFIGNTITSTIWDRLTFPRVKNAVHRGNILNGKVLD